MFREFCKENTRLVRIASLFSIIAVCMCFMPTEIKADQMQGREILEGVWEGDSIMYLDSMVLVVLHDTATQAQFETESSTLGCATLDDIDAIQFLTVNITDGTTVFAMCDSIELRSTVKYAIPNVYDTVTLACDAPSDTGFYRQWYLHNTGQAPALGTADADSDYLEIRALTSGVPSVRIGILDSGIPIDSTLGTLSHPDLDDTTRIILGRDFWHGDDEPQDELGHGTPIAGIIGARTDNVEGMAGIAPGCEMLIVQTHGPGGSFSAQTAHDAVVYAVNNGCDVISCSWFVSPISSLNQPIKDALIYAKDSGVVACFAIGNGSSGVRFPANLSDTLENIIAVGAVNLHDSAFGFNSSGPEITVAAPSGDNLNDERLWTTGLGGSYTLFGKTSGATPQVAALAGLILSLDSTLTPSQVRNIITSTADDVIDPNNELYGAGRINIQAALLKVIDSVDEIMEVPSEASTIQTAICAARDTWTVNVAAGTYNENIRFEGRAITVISEDGPKATEINGARFYDDEDENSVLEGFKVDGGSDIAVECRNAGPTIKYCLFVNQSIYNNEGAISLFGASHGVEGTSPARIINCTIAGCNKDGIMDMSTDPPEIRNCIIYDNDGFGINFNTNLEKSADQPINDYNDVYLNGTNYKSSITVIGDSSISADPPFYPAWTLKHIPPSSPSPCVDAGDPDVIYNDTNGTRNDMGALPWEPPGEAEKATTEPEVPRSFSLSQNFPNPFNPISKISLILAEKSEWKIDIYNVMGQKVESFTGVGEAGTVTVEWNATRYASGIYLYKATAGAFTQTRKMILLK